MGNGRAENTIKTHLRHIDRFYLYCDSRFGSESLDNSLGDKNAPLLRRMLDDFYLSLTATGGYTSTDAQCWDSVKRFVLHFAQQWAVEHPSWAILSNAVSAIGRIRSPQRGRIKFARALPEATLKELLVVAEPGSALNPFQDPAVQSRNWLILLILLLCGLRRGEALLLTVDALKHDVDTQTGEFRYWLDVTSTGDDDTRATKPSMKTAESHRQVPISADLAALYERYVAEYRVDDYSHRFLITSSRGGPASAETINKMLTKLTSVISRSALKLFHDRTSGKQSISPHDLRHTSATVRYGLFLEAGADRDLAMQRMRAFFGWSIESEMPALYARAAIQDDLLKSWSNLFDKRVSALRATGSTTEIPLDEH